MGRDIGRESGGGRMATPPNPHERAKSERERRARGAASGAGTGPKGPGAADRTLSRPQMSAQQKGVTMSQHQPHQIKPHHLDRLAVVYREQARPQEVEGQIPFPADQRDGREPAIRWGWPEKAIEVIEEARGPSGPGADGREGFKRLRKLVAQERVGIILVFATSCPPRSGSDLLSLFGLCQDTDTLLAFNGAIVDLDEHTDHVLAKIRASCVADENQRRANALMKAKRAHAAWGRAVSRPPTGYVVIAKGQWGKDVPAVGERIEGVFALYEALGTVRKVVRSLAAKGLEIPLRTQAGRLCWVRPTHSRIYRILTDPTFMGWYVFGRRAKVRGTLHGRQRKTTWEERVVVRDHHEPYIAAEDWHRINRRLQSNAVRVRQQARNGAAT